MANNKNLEMRELSDEDLNNDLVATQEEYLKMKFDHAVKGLDNPLNLRETRRDIARLQTELRRREVEKMSEEELANRSKKRARRRKK